MGNELNKYMVENPYKIARDILSASSAPDCGFSSIDLYGSSVQEKNEGFMCSTFHLENESGTGDITVYQAFPGMELVYNDMHMEYCNKTQNPRSGVIEINYCREGQNALIPQEAKKTQNQKKYGN